MGAHDFFIRLWWVVALIFMQVLFFNNICFFGYATPMAYVYILCLLPQDLSRNAWLLWGFMTGLCVDFFSETPGLCAASMTITAMFAPSMMNLFAPKDDMEEKHGVLSLEESAGRRYAVLLVLFHHAVYVLLEVFSFFHPLHMLYTWAGSCVLTLMIIFAFSRLKRKKRVVAK